MNKTQLVDALAERLGDRRTAATAVDGLLDTIVSTVQGGDSVSITGFGVFESRARAARTGRNPRTGEAIAVPAATVPAFRPGTAFRNAVGGTTSSPEPRSTPRRAASSSASSGAAAEAKPKAKEAPKKAAAAPKRSTAKAKPAAKDEKPKKGRANKK